MADTYQPPSEPLYLTPDELPSGVFCRTFGVPDDPTWNGLFDAALLDLIHPEAWREFGTLTPDECAEAWRAMLYASWDYSTACDTVPAPFWDETSGDDSDDTAPITDQPWYGQIVIIDDRLTFVENAFIYVVAGFIAYAGLPTAAISFVPLARQFVVTAKSNPLGGIIRFLADGVELGRTDTYSPTDGVVSTPIYMPAPTTSFVAESVSYPNLWVELLPDNPHELPSVSMTVIRSRLSPSDFSDTSYRYNSDCDCVQYTPDGGTTWRDAPGNDPRHAPQFLLPPVGGSNQQCDAAANKNKWLKDFIDSLTNALIIGGIAATLVNTALEFVDLLFPGAALLELLIEFADTTFGVGAAALEAAFTSDQYDLLECIFYCHSESDGKVTASELSDIEAAVTAQLNTTAALIVNLILQIQGENGVSNAGAIGSETGDCTGCDCGWCWHDDLTTTEGSFTASPGSYSSGWVEGFVNGAGCGTDATYTYLDMSRSLPDGVYTKIFFTIELTKGVICEANTNLMHVTGGGGITLESVSSGAQPDGTHTFTWTGTLTNPGVLRLVWVCGEQPGTDNPGGTLKVTDVQYSGTGDPPFGSSNC